MTDLTPQEIARLQWPAKSRFGIADKLERRLVHSSDSQDWIQAEFWRMTLPCGMNATGSNEQVAVAVVEQMVKDSRYQVVIRV